MALLLIAFASCRSKTQRKDMDSALVSDTTKSKTNNPINKSRSIDFDRFATLPDSVDDTPTQAEERERLSKTYDDIKIIDSTFISNNDTLHFHLKYYCLKNIDLLEPKPYDPDRQNPKEFLTHPFVSNISLIHNRDTVLNKQFKADDLNPFFEDNFGGALKKYGSLMMPKLARRNKDKSRIVLDYPIAIPATDIGIGMFLIISKNGNYRFVENY